MRRPRLSKVASATAGALLCAALAQPTYAQRESGFLKDYSQLQMTSDANGIDRRLWLNTSADMQHYHSVLVEPIQFYPKLEGTVRVTLETLYDIRDYLNASIPRAVAASMPVAKAEWPGVLRLRWAVTELRVDTRWKLHHFLPIALPVIAAKLYTGTSAYDVKLRLETELTDSVTGEVLARSVREASGLEVIGDQPITLSVVRPQLDLWLAGFQEEIALRTRKAAAR